MPVWHIAAFLWMFSQPAFKVHRTWAFSRMTTFILLSYRKKNSPTAFLEEKGANHWIHALCTATPNSTSWIHGTQCWFQCTTPFSRPQSLPGPFMRHHYHQEPLTSTNNPINLLSMAWQKPNYMIKFCQKIKAHTFALKLQLALSGTK